MDEREEKQLLKYLRTYKVSDDAIRDQFGLTPSGFLELLRSLKEKGILVRSETARDGQTQLYHVPVLPEIGNVYTLSESAGDETLRFGAGADFHFASTFHLAQSWHECMKRLEDRGINLVFVAGDIHDGNNIYKGHLENLVATSIEDQTDLAAEALRRHPRIMFYGIAGNHDFSFTQQNGAKPLALLEAKSDNFRNLGDLRADVTIQGLKVRLLHGAGGRSYARSYPSQTYLRDFFGGLTQEEMKHLPQVMVLGHYHTLYDGFDHAIHVLQPGSFQDGDNEYCIRRGLTGPTGLFDVTIQHNGAEIAEFVPNYLHATSAARERGERHAHNTRNYR